MVSPGTHEERKYIGTLLLGLKALYTRGSTDVPGAARAPVRRSFLELPQNESAISVAPVT